MDQNTSNSVRRANILKILEEHGQAKVRFLADSFDASEVTIRKDLADLETQGLLIRKFGGAVRVPPEFGLTTGVVQNPAKTHIAKAAAELIDNNARIIIDSGRTTNALLPFLGAKHGLVVMTNTLDTAVALAAMESEPTLIMPGGTWDKQSGSFQGQFAEKLLQEYDFDWLFIGADGIDCGANKGTTTFNELVGLSQAMAKAAKHVVVMAESTKIGRRMHNVELTWPMISYLVTDSNISDQHKTDIIQQGVELICVDGQY